MENVILLDTDAVINFFSINNTVLKKSILDYKNNNDSKILVTYFTWYELFKSTTDFLLIKSKLENLINYTDGIDIYEEIPTKYDHLFDPNYWLSKSQFPILEFNQFILDIKEMVYSKINAHIMDILLIEIHTILFFEHVLDMNNVYNSQAYLTYQSYVLTMRDKFKPAVLELLRRHSDDNKFLNKLLFDMYKGTQVLKNSYIETESEFLNRIKRFPYTDIIKVLKKDKSNLVSSVPATKDDLLDMIYDQYYVNNDIILGLCKKFIVKKSPVAGGKFCYNDFIDMSNLLLSTNTRNAEIVYITNDKKWIDFISLLSEKHGIKTKTL